jgi:hypothetical protein
MILNRSKNLNLRLAGQPPRVLSVSVDRLAERRRRLDDVRLREGSGFREFGFPLLDPSRRRGLAVECLALSKGDSAVARNDYLR